MRLRRTITAMAVLASTSTMAGFHGFSDPMTSRPNNERIQELLDRNYNPFFAQHDFFNRVYFSGLIQANAFFSNLNPNAGRFVDRRTSSDIFVNRANLFVDALVNDWVNAHAAFNFLDNNSLGVYRVNDEAFYRNFGIVDEATVTVGNLQQYPTYLRAGIGYARYGHYKRNAVPMTLTQALTQTQAALVEVGFVDNSGWNGAIYAFHGNSKRNTSNPTINNFGLQLGYCWHEEQWGLDLTADYMFNIAGAVNALQPQTTGTAVVPPALLGAFVPPGFLPAGVTVGVPVQLAPNALHYDKVVGGVHLGARGHYNEFDGTVQFTTALRKFGALGPVAANQRPAAVLVDVGYNFPLAGLNSRLGVSYQQSFNAQLPGSRAAAPNQAAATAIAGGVGTFNNATLGLPEHRVQGDLTFDVWKNTQVGAHVIWDNPYRVAGRRPTSSVTGLLSVQAKIA